MGEEYLTGEMVEILRQMLVEQKQTNARLGSMDARLGTMDARLGTIEDELIGFRSEVHEDFAMVHAGQKDILTELRGLRGEAGTDVIKLKERVERLEAAVFPAPPRPARRAGARR